MSLVSTLNRAAQRLYGGSIDQAIGSNDPNTAYMLALMGDIGDELASAHAWSRTTIRREFSARGQVNQLEPPNDYGRFAPVSELWRQSPEWKMQGPLSPEAFNEVVTREVNTTSNYWTLRKGKIWIYPAPAEGEIFTYTYVSSHWRLSGGNPSDMFLDDSDTFVFPEFLGYLGLLATWREAKGLDYSKQYSDYMRERDKAIARDRGPRSVKIGKAQRDDGRTYHGRVIA